MDKLLKFNIQMFADSADNDVDDTIDAEDTSIEDTETDTDSADGEIEVETETKEVEVDTKKAETKAFSERLNKERERLKEELEAENINRLNAIAQSRGFDSWDELEEYSESQKLQEFGVTDKDEFKKYLDEMISKNPTVKEANAILQKQKEEERNNYIKSEVLEINKFDSEIKTFDDLTKLDRYNDFKSKLDKGYSLSDAYKVVYYDKLKSKEIESVKQDTLLKLDSKSHMKTTSGTSSKEIFVPEDVMAMYRRNTKLTDEQIRKHYAKQVGGNE